MTEHEIVVPVENCTTQFGDKFFVLLIRWEETTRKVDRKKIFLV